MSSSINGEKDALSSVKGTWKRPEDYDNAAEALVSLFQENFELFTEDADESVIGAGPVSLDTEPDIS